MFSQFLLASAAAFSSLRRCSPDRRRHCRPAQPVSFSVLFGMSQNIGGLLFGYSRHLPDLREKFHSSQLADQLTTLNPLITERLQQYSQLYQSQIGDSTLLNVQASTLLQNAATLQANILPTMTPIFLTAAISAGTLICVLAVDKTVLLPVSR